MIDNQTIKDRILLWIEAQNMSVSAFERKCGLSVGYVSNLKPNTNSKKINDILNAFPNLNREWLLTGEGSMLNPCAEDSPAQPADSAAPPTTLDKALDEIAAQRRIVERLLCVIEKMAGGTAK